MLKELGKYPMDRKEFFYPLSATTGATRTDSWIDIKGGISTLFVFSGKGRREMPNGHVYLDGNQEVISRNGSLPLIIFTPRSTVSLCTSMLLIFPAGECWKN